tara:strand:- start:444 stop:728 length:285 start_codon:yes stop_codon:yes gene_type:complete
MAYKCRKNFRYGKQPYKINQPFNADSATMADMLKRGLLYETKEDKKAYKKEDKIHIEKDDTTKTMYYVKKGNQIIDRLTKAKAEKLMDELNELA